MSSLDGQVILLTSALIPLKNLEILRFSEIFLVFSLIYLGTESILAIISYLSATQDQFLSVQSQNVENTVRNYFEDILTDCQAMEKS